MLDVAETSDEFQSIINGIVTYNNTGHQINKKAYKIRFNKQQDNTYYSRFSFNLFKLIRDNLNPTYTICLEMYFPAPVQTDEYNNSTLDFTAINLGVSRHISKHINTAYKYMRTIINVSKQCWPTTKTAIR